MTALLFLDSIGKFPAQTFLKIISNFCLTTVCFPDRDRALFGVCLYTACRVAQACNLKVIDVFTPVGDIRSEMVIRFRQHQRQARQPHPPDHPRAEAAAGNIQTSPTPLPASQPPPQPPLEAREPGSRRTPVPGSLRATGHHRRFHPQPAENGTDPDEQRRDWSCGEFKKSVATVT